METPFDVFEQQRLADIVIPGYVDEAGYQQPPHYFHPILDEVYLEFEKTLIKLGLFNQSGQLPITLVDKIQPPFELDGEDLFCACSLMDWYRMSYPIQAGQEVRVVSFRGFLDEESNPDRFLFRAVELMFSSADILFFDPMHFFGIHIGGPSHRDRWLKDNGDLVEKFGDVRWCPSRKAT